jgi:excisionase family DNA binding protein
MEGMEMNSPALRAALPPVDPHQRYEIPEACAYLRVGRVHLYKRIAAGELGILKDGTRTFVPGSEIIRLSTLPSRQAPRQQTKARVRS